ncbi:3-oxoadipyl-CoA thiolase [Marinicella litoralis]|uniref:Beta-ketoadipyl-CoA thiolase n=1 Tax=Marinicella litoralis TaxID=644220 RepID=A0A4R6XMI4_9GAMM|nr:3-oxoadipyl-CoA thiolase [Marinicella litoralis]TDR18513.1 3-oxoadipyl-CoA thiolase [Marinicella litoralis]
MRKVYICDGIRTPIGRFAGGLAGVRPDDMLAHVIKTLMTRNPQLPIDDVDDVIAGCANQAGEDNRNVAKMSALLAGLPTNVAGMTVNRLCASGLDAIAMAARTIAFGDAEVIVAGGVESMSRAPFVMPKATAAYSRQAEIYDTTIGWRFINPKLQNQYGTDSMPETGENVAEKFKVSREDQDLFAYRSQQKAAVAQQQGVFKEEIVPVVIPQRKGDDVIVDADEHPRADTKLEKLAQLGTPFKANGTVTAGNASGVNDGACALIIASEDAVSKYGLNPMARFVGANVAGVDPDVMGIGPVPASKQLLVRYGLTINDVDVIELNEAFASQGLAVMRMLGLTDDDPRVNPNGGAIALGHPLGMSGARLALTATRQLQRTGGRYALCTMCIGVGQGMAMLIERV